MKCTMINSMLLLLDATIYVGGLDDKVTDTLMWELFVQAGPVGKYCYVLLFSNYRENSLFLFVLFSERAHA